MNLRVLHAPGALLEARAALGGATADPPGLPIDLPPLQAAAEEADTSPKGDARDQDDRDHDDGGLAWARRVQGTPSATSRGRGR